MMTWSEFRRLISQHFDIEELKILCFDLDIDYDNLPGERKDRKVAELIDHLRSHKRIPDLVDALTNIRPPIHWEGILQEWESDKPAYQVRKTTVVATQNTQTSLKNNAWMFILGSILIISIFALTVLFIVWPKDADNGQVMVTHPPDNTPQIPTTLANAAAAIITTNTPIPTTTPTKTTTSTASPTPLPSATPILVESVEPDEYMVLVADLENLDGSERKITRFIVDDLQQYLEDTLPDSRIRIRKYDDSIITSKREALILADRVGADVIIWGNYDEDIIYANLQVGSLAGFPNSVFSRDEIAQVTDVRVVLTNEREQSLAIPVISILVQMAVAANDTSEMIRLTTMSDFLPQELLDFEGNSMATHYHQSVFYLIKNPELALPEIGAALAIKQHPLLYMGRGVAYAKLGDIHAAMNDWNSANLLAPEGWSMPQSGISFAASIVGDVELALVNANYVIENQEDDWYGYYLQGIAAYLAGEYELSTESFQNAIERDPSLNFPYTFAIVSALRQNDIEQAKTLAATSLQKFPDPDLGVRIIQFVFGDDGVVGSSSAAILNLILGQYEDVLINAEYVLGVDDSITDMYLAKGFAHCNLGNYADAEDAYTTAIALEPSYTLLYLLRSEVYQKQGKNEAAFADIQTILTGPDSVTYTNLLMDAQAGKLSCETFWTD